MGTTEPPGPGDRAASRAGQRAGWSERLLREGVDPDPRFSMANERTFLAWIRTSLGLIALGVGIATFVSSQQRFSSSLIAAAALVALGGVVAAASWYRWLRVERAMRMTDAMPPPRLGLWLALGVAVLAGVLLVVVAVGALE